MRDQLQLGLVRASSVPEFGTPLARLERFFDTYCRKTAPDAQVEQFSTALLPELPSESVALATSENVCGGSLGLTVGNVAFHELLLPNIGVEPERPKVLVQLRLTATTLAELVTVAT